MSKPRHETGKYPAYDSSLALFRYKSAVLNTTSHMNAEAWGMSSKGGLLALLEEYQEKWDRAAELIDQVAQAFEDRKLQARRLGKREPTEMPPDLVEVKFRQEARADVILEEITHIKELLAKFEVQAKKEDEAKVLQYGPMGTSRGEPTREIDGQSCRTDSEGFPYIDCEKSPYHQMRVVDYRELICKPWRAAKNRAHREFYDKAHDLELSEAERKRWGEKAAMILRDPHDPPWPPRPEES